MPPFVYRCPATGLNVQGWFADDVPGSEGATYEAVPCIACSQLHLVNRSTGRTLVYRFQRLFPTGHLFEDFPGGGGPGEGFGAGIVVSKVSHDGSLQLGVDLPRFGGRLRACGHGTRFDGILSSC